MYLSTSAASGTALAPVDPQIEPLMVIALIIVFAGLFGGSAAYLSLPRTDRDGSAPTPGASWASLVLLGLVAAASVPLFLSILKSGLIAETLRPNNAPLVYEDYLIFAGLCLLAAFSARRFIETVTEQLLRKVDDARREAAQATATAAQATETAHEALSEIEAVDDVEASPAPETPGAAPAAEPREVEDEGVPEERGARAATAAPLTPEERRILEAMRKRTYRTATGIAEDSGIANNRISEFLEDLAARKLVLPTRSPTTGGARWAISERGRNALRHS